MKKLQENTAAKFRSVKGVMADTNMSRNVIMQIAADAEAIVRYGKRGIRIDIERFYWFLRNGGVKDA